MQLVAYGAQDVYLTGNPQITFFKVVYRRHTNFAMETVELTMNSQSDFARRSTVTVLRNGDLAFRAYLRLTIGAVTTDNFTSPNTHTKFAWVRRLGHAIIDNIEIQIGGSRIDRQYGHWLDIWYELTHAIGQERGYAHLIGDIPEVTKLEGVKDDGYTFKDEVQLHIPLQFWFNRNSGLALPLIALQYHEVRFDIDFARADGLYVYAGPSEPKGLQITNASLLVDYIYLDSDERRRFAQVGHEYLIEQLQFTGNETIPTTTGNSTISKTKLQFNHPSKELIWAVKGGNYVTGQKFLAYTHENDWTNTIDNAALNLATGMFKIAAAGVVAGEVNVSVDGSYVTGTSGHTADIIVLLNDGVTYGGVGSDELVNPGGGANSMAKMIQNVLKDVNSTYNLGDKIEEVTLTIGLNGAGAIAIQGIAVTSHTLTIRDLSIPLSNFTDLRTSALDDVYVNQFNNYGLLIDGTVNPVEKAIIRLNGHDRFDEREGSYFNYVQPYQHHTDTPADGINVYSFALHPEQHQPSGSANLSRIDTTQLEVTLRDMTIGSLTVPGLQFFNNNTDLYIYDFSYNVLRIMSGMGGLAYSN